MARTAEIRRCGGYPEFPLAMHIDDAMWVKLSLGHEVVLAEHGAFRWRVEEESAGHGAPYYWLADAVKLYLRMLDTDPTIQAYAGEHPARWKRLRGRLRRASAKHYLWVWATIYRSRMSRAEWIRAGFALPWLPRYYIRVLKQLLLPPGARQFR